ncbi:MAG: tetratricopeptide repeat protein [Thermoanaerobaculia bacterium]
MNVWLPGALVVAAGLAAGFWFVWRAPRNETAPGAARDPADLHGPDSRIEAPESALARGTRRARVQGFLSGVASCLVVGGLVYWATEGAERRTANGPATGGSAMGGRAAGAAAEPGSADGTADEAHDGSASLSPEAAAEIQRLQGQLAAAPQNLDARRQLTVALLNANQLMPAYEQARELERLSPGDPDGLFVEGVVRLAMGQWQQSIALMDQVLNGHPDHLLAAMAKGQAQVALGDTDAAVATWKKGLAAAGGHFPPIEELLSQVEAGNVNPAAGNGASRATGETPGYRIRVELAPGLSAPSGKGAPTRTLFVALRGANPGPPAAVKRIADPTFPLELTLSAEDSMLGTVLPESGNITVRLDADGNASTNEPGDLSATAASAAGSVVTLVLTEGTH